MTIPTNAGATVCRQCEHFPKCSWLLSRKGHETSCDWIPTRFRLPVVKT